MKALGMIILEAAMLLGLMGFADVEQPQSKEEAILGIWEVGYIGNATNVYQRLDEILPNTGPAFQFLADGKLLVRQNAGWCGTPPISYSNFKGHWHVQGDTLTMVYDFWGGEMTEILWIGEIEDDKMSLMYIDQYTEYDERFD